MKGIENEKRQKHSTKLQKRDKSQYSCSKIQESIHTQSQT